MGKKGIDFFDYLEQNAEKIKKIDFKGQEVKINVETIIRIEGSKEYQYKVLSQLAKYEEIEGETIFQFHDKILNGKQNAKRFINAIKRATTDIKNQPRQIERESTQVEINANRAIKKINNKATNSQKNNPTRK